ncbi:MAG: FAD-dependent oxidoreductase [Clostridia bacterium]|nr:FAD-dependent oxidoreductase [Clostridia bacterium]
MKKILALLLALLVSLHCLPTLAEAALQDGTYTASSAGMGGEVPVTLSISGGQITEVAVGENNETPGIGTLAIEQLPDVIVDQQSADVDVVTGATITSNAILSAVKQCLVQACAPQESAAFVPGTYEGEGMGMRGTVKVSVTIDDNAELTDIQIVGHNETIGIREAAFDRVPKDILAGQTLNVDAVTGATLSSSAIRTGVRDALTKAAIADKFVSAPAYAHPSAYTSDMEADIVVVGGGLAGMMTAYKAASDGASVIIVEKNGYMGGSFPRSAGYMYTLNSQVQKDAGFDVPEEGEYAPEHTFTNTFIYHASGKAIDAMTEMGTDYALVAPTAMIFGPAMGLGGGSVALRLTDAINRLNIPVLYETAATELICEDDTVVGVEVRTNHGETFSVRGKAVILTTGGWSNNESMIATYQPEAVGQLRGGNRYATGDGHEMARALHAGFVNLEDGNLAYSISPRTYQYLTFALHCGIMVDKNGQRFLDEAYAENDYIYLDKAVLSIPDNRYYMVMDSANAATSGEPGLIETLVKTGAAHAYTSLEELAQSEQIPGLHDTIARYNSFCENGVDEEFGREKNGAMLPIALDGDVYYCVEGTIGYYSSLGGIDVDTACHVLDENGEIIRGLYAAGEVTGNCYYHDLGYYGGGLGTAYSMGWVAGETAASEIR